MDVINSTKLKLLAVPVQQQSNGPLAHRRLWEQTTLKSIVHTTLGPSVPTKQERNQKKRKKNKSKKEKFTSRKNTTYSIGQNIKPIYLNSPPETTHATLIAR